jgi:predicted transcriptional regulator
MSCEIDGSLPYVCMYVVCSNIDKVINLQLTGIKKGLNTAVLAYIVSFSE